MTQRPASTAAHCGWRPSASRRTSTSTSRPHQIVAELGYCAYEGLFTYDMQYQAIPELVATHTVSDDGLTHTMALRQGVMFHNGEELKAADAIASLERWGRISGVGKRLMEKTSELAQVDDYTIEFRLSEPYGTILIALAHNTQACTIHPKSILDAAGDDPITDPEQYIGTGPYRLVEWQRDAAMRFERFDDYKSSLRTARRATAAPSTPTRTRSSSSRYRTRRRAWPACRQATTTSGSTSATTSTPSSRISPASSPRS